MATWGLLALLAPPAVGAAGVAPFPAFTWPNDPPEGIPFARSEVFREVEFTGRHASYGAADTWYPTWAADGNLYSPWTDGSVGGAHAASGCTDAGCDTTTGYATVVGSDPMNLTLLVAGTSTSSALPYHGRYPCGSLHYGGVWLYGTYALDNEGHGPGAGLGEAGYCGNWCVQGPFVGFRWSTDNGRSWTEPRPRMGAYNDNVFGESAPDNHTRKVKFGAPHVVDLGRELEHTPQGDSPKLMYIVGHGASHGDSPTSWMQGSEVYMARVPPTIEAVQDHANWDFYTGHGNWAKGDVARAAPLISWPNRTGATTMTYIPAVRRYVMCISTPTFSPFTVRQFDTYFLESEAITGPFRYITYMRMFGPQSYFVNIPSKFMAPTVDPKDGSLTLFLSYSANFAIHEGESPPGSGYHWTLQEARFKRGSGSNAAQVRV